MNKEGASQKIKKCSKGYKCVPENRCDFFGSVSRRKLRKSVLTEALSESHQKCVSRKKIKNSVCCKERPHQSIRLRQNDIITIESPMYEELDFYTDPDSDIFYMYDDDDDSLEYEEDYDMNFDKITVFSHVNAPGGR